MIPERLKSPSLKIQEVISTEYICLFCNSLSQENRNRIERIGNILLILSSSKKEYYTPPVLITYKQKYSWRVDSTQIYFLSSISTGSDSITLGWTTTVFASLSWKPCFFLSKATQKIPRPS